MWYMLLVIVVYSHEFHSRESAGSLYPVLGFNLTAGRNKFTVIYLNKQMLVATQSYEM